MAKTAGTVQVDVKPVIDFSAAIEQLDVLANTLLQLGESLAEVAIQLSNNLVELKLQEMTK